MPKTFADDAELMRFFAFTREARTSARLLYRRLILGRLFKTPIPAAVLVGFYTPGKEEDEVLILTERNPHLKDHAGQIAFPGGRREAKESLIQTAMRETEEEIGVPMAAIHDPCPLKKIYVPTGFIVTPVLARVTQQPISADKNAEEVAAVFFLPARVALNPQSYQFTSARWRGLPFSQMSLTYEHYYIWGLTAEILYFLACRFAAFKK